MTNTGKDSQIPPNKNNFQNLDTEDYGSSDEDFDPGEIIDYKFTNLFSIFKISLNRHQQ
jgi:hypothetical protein